MIFLLRKFFSYSVFFVKTGSQPILNNISRLRRNGNKKRVIIPKKNTKVSFNFNPNPNTLDWS